MWHRAHNHMCRGFPFWAQSPLGHFGFPRVRRHLAADLAALDVKGRTFFWPRCTSCGNQWSVCSPTWWTLVAEPFQAPYHELSYIPYNVDYFNIEPNASPPLLRCRDPHALRAALAWATYILQNVFFELPFFAFAWSWHRQGLLHPRLLEQARGLPRMEDENSPLPTEDGAAEEGQGGMHQPDDKPDWRSMAPNRAPGRQGRGGQRWIWSDPSAIGSDVQVRRPSRDAKSKRKVVLRHLTPWRTDTFEPCGWAPRGIGRTGKTWNLPTRQGCWLGNTSSSWPIARAETAHPRKSPWLCAEGCDGGDVLLAWPGLQGQECWPILAWKGLWITKLLARSTARLHHWGLLRGWGWQHGLRRELRRHRVRRALGWCLLRGRRVRGADLCRQRWGWRQRWDLLGGRTKLWRCVCNVSWCPAPDGTLESLSRIFPGRGSDWWRWIYSWFPNVTRPKTSKGQRPRKIQVQVQEQDQHLGQQGRTDSTASQRHTLSQVWSSWTLGSPLPTELTFEVAIYDTAEPYILSYLNISVQEGQGQRWICDNGARHGQTRTSRSTTPGPCWMVWTSRWRDKLCCCGGATMWVSSERQYSDGLTKQSAAQLLADRLRTHLVESSWQVMSRLKHRRRRTQGTKKERPDVCREEALSSTGSDVHHVHDGNLQRWGDWHPVRPQPLLLYQPELQNVVPILITTIMALLFGYWWMRGHLATWTLPTTSWRATGETRAEAEAFQEASRPASVFADAGAETDIRMGDVVTQTEYVQLVDSIETTYISREDHHRALSVQEAHSRLDAHHRVQSPIYFTQNGCCWHADYFCLRRQAATRIHQREFCTRCCQSLGSAMAPQDWERDLWDGRGGQ